MRGLCELVVGSFGPACRNDLCAYFCELWVPPRSCAGWVYRDCITFCPAKPNRAGAFHRLQRRFGHLHGAQTDITIRDRGRPVIYAPDEMAEFFFNGSAYGMDIVYDNLFWALDLVSILFLQ